MGHQWPGLKSSLKTWKNLYWHIKGTACTPAKTGEKRVLSGQPSHHVTQCRGVQRSSGQQKGRFSRLSCPSYEKHVWEWTASWTSLPQLAYPAKCPRYTFPRSAGARLCDDASWNIMKNCAHVKWQGEMTGKALLKPLLRNRSGKCRGYCQIVYSSHCH